MALPHHLRSVGLVLQARLLKRALEVLTSQHARSEVEHAEAMVRWPQEHRRTFGPCLRGVPDLAGDLIEDPE
jgi:hypothetical protein